MLVRGRQNYSRPLEIDRTSLGTACCTQSDHSAVHGVPSVATASPLGLQGRPLGFYRGYGGSRTATFLRSRGISEVSLGISRQLYVHRGTAFPLAAFRVVFSRSRHLGLAQCHAMKQTCFFLFARDAFCEQDFDPRLRFARKWLHLC